MKKFLIVLYGLLAIVGAASTLMSLVALITSLAANNIILGGTFYWLVFSVAATILFGVTEDILGD